MSDPSALTMPPPSSDPGRVGGRDHDDENVDLLQVLVLVTAEWRTGLVTALIVLLAGLLIIWQLPEEFQAYAIILPKDAPGGGSALAAFFGGGRPSSASLSLLTSRTLKDDVIRRANLMPYFHTTSQEAARKELTAKASVVPGPDTILLLARDRSGEVAARIANAYVDALRSMQEAMATSQNDLQRHFFEQQVQREKDALAKAESDLELSQESSGVVQMDTQTQIGLSAIANARAQITVLQVRLAVLLGSETEENPEIKTLRSQIAQLQGEERQLESGTGASGAGVAAAAGKLPAVNLEYQRKLREVRFHEALVNALSNHFEDIRLGSSTPGESFQVLDSAIVPEFPTWPPRQSYRLLAIGAGVLAGLLAITLKLLVRRMLRNPVRRAHLGVMRGHFKRTR